MDKQLVSYLATLPNPNPLSQAESNFLISGFTKVSKRSLNSAELLKSRLCKYESSHKDITPQRRSDVNQNPVLTPLHLEILKRLMMLQIENGKRYISMKDLASELYPTKAYSTIKATLSEYLKRLHQKDLIEKLNKGRLYVSYTEGALKYADSQRITRMKDLIRL